MVLEDCFEEWFALFLELLLFEKLFYCGCSSRKHTTPVTFGTR